MLIVFIIAGSIIIYHLFFYIIILKLFSIFIRKNDKENIIENYPTISVLCPAFNEEKHIEAKIKSFLDLDYPKDKIKMIVISDDSTDRTNEIVKNYIDNHNLELVVQKPRKGKPSGHNLVEPSIDTDYVLSTDANSIFKADSVKKLVKTMISDEKTGMVIGKLQLISKGKDSGEGIYWKYENFLKLNESRLHSIICANGSLFLLKRELFTQIHPSSVDDFERTLIALEKGYLAKYNEQAIVTEDVTEEPTDELKRKIRIISREWFALFRHAKLLNPITNFKNTLFLFSHKIIRWLLPVWSAIIFISSIILGFHSMFFAILAVLQVLVYCGGLIEIKKESKGASIKLFKIPGYFLVINISAFLAFVKFIKGEQMTNWNTIRKT